MTDPLNRKSLLFKAGFQQGAVGLYPFAVLKAPLQPLIFI